MTPLFPPGDEPDANAAARTATAERVLAEARRILDTPGHSQERIDWAKSIMAANLWPRKT